MRGGVTMESAVAWSGQRRAFDTAAAQRMGLAAGWRWEDGGVAVHGVATRAAENAPRRARLNGAAAAWNANNVGETVWMGAQ